MNHLKNIGLWLLYFIPAILIELMCYGLAPLVACFIHTEPRTDKVKRFGPGQFTMPRDYLIKPLYWFQTHDNACDEWWYGLYNVDHWFKFARNWIQNDYDNSRIIRWYCRWMWLWRNCGYGFLYALLSRPKEPHIKQYIKGKEGAGYWHQIDVFESSFKIEMQVPYEALRIIVATLIVAYVVIFDPNLYTGLVLAITNLAFWYLIKGRFFSMNIGWKAHKLTDRLLYANRIISFRKYD